jgi:hypothetical protein
MKIVNYLPFTIVLLLWITLTLYVFIQSPNFATHIKVLVVPLAVITAVLSFKAVEVNAGYPYYVQKLPERFMYLGHKVIINDKFEKIGIDVWSQKGHRTRLFAIPWSKQMEKVLNAAQEKKKGFGGQGEVEMRERHKKNKEGSSEGDDEDPYDSDLKLPSYNQTKPEYMT